MTREDLLQLIADIQGYQGEMSDVDVKTARGGTPQRLYESLSAFANRTSDGVLLCGLDEGRNFEVVGVGFAALAAKLMRIPLVLSVQDIYPESLVAQDRLKETGLLFRCLRGLDGVIARSAREIVVIAESFRRLYVRGRRVDPARVHVVPNWVESGSVTM